MAQQEEPLYDFPEPSQPSERKFAGHQRERGSLRSISVLDRLLLTVPVWLQLSINPATALHILQREPPGVRATYTRSPLLSTYTLTVYLSLPSPSMSYALTHARSVIIVMLSLQNFLVRKSRTSQRNVLCVRLADDSVPSFVQQFGIREEHSSKSEFCLRFTCLTPNTSAIHTESAFFFRTETFSHTCAVCSHIKILSIRFCMN